MEPICQSCGNDIAFHHLCSDCLRPSAADLALGLSDELGGNAEDYTDMAQRIVRWWAA